MRIVRFQTGGHVHLGNEHGDGRVTRIAVMCEDVTQRHDEDERQRLLMLRLFSLFDLTLPDEKGWSKGWTQKGVLPIFFMMNTTGTTGSMKLQNSHSGNKDGYVFIETTGRAVINSGSGVDSGGGNMVDVNLAGNTLFDEPTGMLYYRNISMDGELTASSNMSTNTPYYIQEAAIQRVTEYPPPGKPPQ